MARKAKLERQLQARRIVDVPLREVSGLGLHRGRNGRISLIAVGDHAAKIAWFSLPHSDDGRIRWRTKKHREASWFTASQTWFAN
jgi:hypothetical protein